MARFASTFEPDRLPGQAFALHFTPAEWRLIIEDPDFLVGLGNAWAPRRLWGLAVKIVPDHRFG
jgi:hypothetical protein